MVRAPAELVYDLTRRFDMQSIPLVRAIFRLRELLLGSKPYTRQPAGLIDEMLRLGWGCLAEEPGHYFVGGAACQPWKADVAFSAIPAADFASLAEPDRVKIAWTIEVEAQQGGTEEPRTLLATETRAVATDEPARRRFLRYWRLVGAGIVLIRRLWLRGLRRRAEEAWRKAGR